MSIDPALKSRYLLRSRIHSCTACPLHKQCTLPVPFSGPSPSNLAIVGEAPGYTEDQRNTPFTGKAGTLLRKTLGGIGINPYDAMIFNALSCRPPNNRVPTPAELHACRPNLLLQLSLSHAKFILVLGATALSTFRSDLGITAHHGRPWTSPVPLGKLHDLPDPATRSIYFPTFHPAAALRDQGTLHSFKKDLELLHVLMQAPNPYEYFPTTCSICGTAQEVSFSPVDYLALCEHHHPVDAARYPRPSWKAPKKLVASSTQVGML